MEEIPSFGGTLGSQGREIRVALPAHLRTLAGLTRGATEVRITVAGAQKEVGASSEAGEGSAAGEASGQETITITVLLDALEEAYPMLRGTIRAHNRGNRRAHMRFFGEGRDLSFAAVDEPLPASIVQGKEPFIVIGAISGG